ncbi:MAG: glycosyltransferase family 39 protein [Bryobacteraceae bacterium]
MRLPHRLALGLVLALIAFTLIGQAARKPFWFDEILTLSIARLPISQEMWTAMNAGFEFNPPVLYLATHAANALFGEGHITTRLPQIVAGLFGLLVGFAVASRHAGVDAGFWFILLLSNTPLYLYFFEARPYAFVFLGTMLAWYAWQRIVEYRGSPLVNYALLVGSLGFVLLSHLWGLVVPVAFLAASVAVSFERGTFAWKEALAVAGTFALLVLNASLIGSNRDIVFGGPVYQPTLRQATIGLYEVNIGAILTFVLLITIGFGVWGRLRGGPLVSSLSLTLPFNELVLSLSLLLAPLFIFAVSKLAKTAFMPRYTLMSCVGAALIGSCILAVATRNHRKLSKLAMVAVGSFLLYQAARTLSKGSFNAPSGGTDWSYLRAAPYSRLPIVFAHPLQFLEADFYAPRELAQRFVYVVDRGLAVEYAGTDGVDAALIKGSKWISLKGRTIDYRRFREAHPEFLLLHDEESALNWISSKLRADGVRMSVIADPTKRFLICNFP